MGFDPVPEVITFDCHGTLVQWHEVPWRTIGTVLAAHERDATEAPAVLDTFSRHSRELEAERPHRLHGGILRAGFRAALAGHGLDPADADVQARPRAPPWGRTPRCRPQERYRLAIITNSDESLIAPTVERIGVPFDHVVTAERAGAYKPSRAIFEHAWRRMGVTPERTVHVAMGMVLDMKAYYELGMRGIWVNRLGQAGPDWLPYDEVPDLTGAAALLLP